MFTALSKIKFTSVIPNFLGLRCITSYSDTINLPKTGFPQHINKKVLPERDKRVLEDSNFADLYCWQQKNMQGPDFTLLDGPPYANGRVHIGHSINKILKDIIIRSKLLCGHRITFKPGWDCHGLPIELKALGETNLSEKNPVEIRRLAREFAKSAAEEQKSAFQSWGVMADWQNQIYHTYHPDYVVRQLQMFWNMFEQGLLYRDLKPVYWSPSSRTALAEAELVYKDTHVSPGITLRLRIANANFTSSDSPVFALIWTTTPWTLPLNEAACYSPDMDYCLASVAGLEGHYLMATKLVATLAEKWKKEIHVVRSMAVSDLQGLKYEHPSRKDLRPILPSGHVTESGTGFVHVAPAHGHDDFLLGLKNGLTRECHVDGEGRYTSGVGPQLKGLSVLDEGSKRVVDMLKENIVFEERYQHSYPYDWRTDKPVIIRASQQWFIDTGALKELALDCLKTVEGSTSRLQSLLSSRPYWCISRQRSWGVPIPSFYHKASGRPLLSKRIVDSLCRRIAAGDLDAWWTAPNQELLPRSACEELYVSPDDVIRGDDIMDIWFDSGMAWTSIDKMADVCIEGVDQHTGWFQSILLTSVAVRNESPTMCFLSHGFAVDENGRKMSKSLGNVVDPQLAKASFGIDALRWWVASQAHHSNIPASDRLLEESRQTLARLRGTLRFLLGALKTIQKENLNVEPEFIVDKYLLKECWKLHGQVKKEYDAHAWQNVCKLVLNFIAGPLSGLYIHIVKDRLYCDSLHSKRRISALSVIYAALETLTSSLAPILPHLAEEIYQHHPLKPGKFWYRQKHWAPNSTWNATDLDISMDKVLELKAAVDKQAAASGPAKLDCSLRLCDADLSVIKAFQEADTSSDSELTELLQVASVTIQPAATNSVVLTPSAAYRCPRCRRYNATADDCLCSRCQSVLQV